MAVAVEVLLLVSLCEPSVVELIVAVFETGPHCAAVAFVVLVSVMTTESPASSVQFVLVG